jgi:Cu(I)-responsive transcriptional regulator
MIRYYEKVGLLPEAQRTDSGYRVYTDEDVHTLGFVRRARDLGFSVKQIQELLALWWDKERASAEVKKLARGHLAELQSKLEKLQAMADTLKHLIEHCHGDDRPDCPILGELGG